MGTSYGYLCKTCNYEYNAIIGRDTGMGGFMVETIVCKDCKIASNVTAREDTKYEYFPIPQTFWQKLFQREIQYTSKAIVSEEIPFEKLCCPNCNGKNIKEWNDTCPKCQDKMESNGEIIMWD
jgi:peptide subunit release factor 1 (eRF1)